MGIHHRVKTGESPEKSLRQFKRKVDRLGIIKIIRATRYYLKPSIVKRENYKRWVKLFCAKREK
jgi:ribosomal protein S21